MGLLEKASIIYHGVKATTGNKDSLRALGNYRDNMSFSILTRVLKSENHESRILALESLSRVGFKAAIPLFITSLKDRNRLVSIAASNILIRTGKSAVPVMIEELKHVDFEQRAQIMDILGKIGDTSAIPAITPHIKEEEAVARLAAALALARIGDKGAIPLILQGIKEGKIYFSFMPSGLQDDLKSADLFRKIFAAYTMAVSKDQAAKQLLIKLVENNYGWTRCFIVRMFVDIGTPEDFPLLLGMVKDDDIWVRRGAVEVLGEIGDSTVMPGLVAAANDNDSWVRSSAASAINKIKARGK